MSWGPETYENRFCSHGFRGDDYCPACENPDSEKCPLCDDTGRVTVRNTYPMAYVCAGDPPEYATGVCGSRCECGVAPPARQSEEG